MYATHVMESLKMTFNERISKAEFVNDIPHFYECCACGFKSHSRKIVIEHQLDDCEALGYLEDSKSSRDSRGTPT